jgi:hypothetical protein
VSITSEDNAYAGTLDIEDLMEAVDEGGIETADGCYVETDGVCPHGHQSPLRVLGMI